MTREKIYKITGSLIIFAGVLSLLFFASDIISFVFDIGPQFGEVESASERSNEEISAFKKDLEPIYASPARLYIRGDEVKVDASIVRVGLEESGKLENPKDWSVAGWYTGSARPGEKGNVIVNAHYDTDYGSPAVFWELKNIKKGARVSLVDDLGKHYTYTVTNLFYIDIQDPNRLKVFEETEGKSELTLITCGGVWLPQERTYNKRLVVKAEFAD